MSALEPVTPSSSISLWWKLPYKHAITRGERAHPYRTPTLTLPQGDKRVNKNNSTHGQKIPLKKSLEAEPQHQRRLADFCWRRDGGMTDLPPTFLTSGEMDLRVGQKDIKIWHCFMYFTAGSAGLGKSLPGPAVCPWVPLPVSAQGPRPPGAVLSP